MATALIEADNREGGAKGKEHAMPEKLNAAVAVIGIDIGKNSFHRFDRWRGRSTAAPSH